MKYAIFKGQVGLYSWQYIDDPNDLKNYPYISEFDLPVVVNRMGGYHHFDKKYEPNFLEIREVADNRPPLTREERYPKNSNDFEYGWIDPEGNTYNTGYEGHIGCAECLCEELGYKTYRYESYLEELGYIKVTKIFERKEVLAPNFHITKKQADVLYDLGLYDNDDVKRLILISERKW